MSNIPFNTVASMLGTTHVARQQAGTIDRRNHDAIRNRQVQQLRNIEHAETVEDPAAYGVLEVGDGRKNTGGQSEEGRPKEPPEGEKVEIAGVTAGPPAGGEAAGPPRLDISA